MTTTHLLCFLCLAVATAFGQECSSSTLRRCQKEGLESLDSRNEDACRSVREKFDCILWQSSMCLDKAEQDATRDSITKLWRHLQSFCESEGSWYTKACYQRDEVKRCESLLPSRGYSIESCRSYSNFRDCASSVVLAECSAGERRLLGTYLMEKGGQRAWNCPRDTHSASAPLAASYDVYCSENARDELRDCRTHFDSELKEADTRNDSDMRHHVTCCAMVHFEECAEQALRQRCGETRARPEARGLVAELQQRFPYNSCEDHTPTECSGCSIATPLLLLMLILQFLLLIR